ncbi:hypothetical protein BASA81_004056 [Batrachochytrium salamandrivorans]|nr:hypothetical protein BASA81_004056 [Batrachochytrium salamandrivorans]
MEDPHSLPHQHSSVARVPVKIGRYLIGKTLGHGSFGKVKQAVHMYTGNQVAIKIIPRKRINTPEMIEKVKREVQILKMMRHPHIIHLHEVLEAPSEIFLVMELVQGQELFDYLVAKGRLHEEEARRLFQQMVSALSYCHLNGVVHRDLKPENILISQEGSIKVADFGLANVMYDGEFLRTSCGSPNYAAPEVIEGLLYAGAEVDVWSLGVILYAMLVGSLPFDDEIISRLFKRIMAGSYPMPSYLSDDSRMLLSRMLCVDSLKRITFAEIRKTSWFRYRLTPYLAVGPAARKLEQKKMEEEIDDEVLDDLLTKVPELRPLSKHRALVERWLMVGISWKITGPVKGTTMEERKHAKNCFGLRVAYDLLLEEKMNKLHIQQQQRGITDVVATGGGSGNTSSNQANKHRSLAFSPNVPNEQVTAVVTVAASDGSQQPPSAHHPESLTPAPAVEEEVKRSWYLGIQSKKETTLVMAEVFRALRSLKCQWHVYTPYRIFCRWRPLASGITDHAKADVWVYASLQVYRIQNKVYLLDFQRLGSYSNSLTWLNFSTLIINALKPPSRTEKTARE